MDLLNTPERRKQWWDSLSKELKLVLWHLVANKAIHTTSSTNDFFAALPHISESNYTGDVEDATLIRVLQYLNLPIEMPETGFNSDLVEEVEILDAEEVSNLPQTNDFSAEMLHEIVPFDEVEAKPLSSLAPLIDFKVGTTFFSRRDFKDHTVSKVWKDEKSDSYFVKDESDKIHHINLIRKLAHEAAEKIPEPKEIEPVQDLPKVDGQFKKGDGFISQRDMKRHVVKDVLYNNETQQTYLKDEKGKLHKLELVHKTLGH